MRTFLRLVWSGICQVAAVLLSLPGLMDASWKFAKEVRSREPVDDQTFWATSYKKEGISFEIATTVRRVYGEQLGHDPLRLRADDFDPALLEIDSIELVIEVEQALDVSISDDESERISGSIDSIVRLVARKLAGAPLPDAMPPKGLAPARRTASSA